MPNLQKFFFSANMSRLPPDDPSRRYDVFFLESFPPVYVTVSTGDDVSLPISRL